MTARLLCALLLLGGAARAYADPCHIDIESNDAMQYNTRALVVPGSCAEVEVSLRHTGHMAAKVMGHDWVLARDGDMSAIVNAGLAAGFSNGYLPANDKRILAATRIVGGGESVTVRFSTAALQPATRYVFFCTSPGHSTVMRGTFQFGETRLARNP
ncbi:MAG: azurin [Gammaproteobacteria bacterium]|nr:azurin [Gammaproteobacteria bacterium]MBV9696509.1 azurin [Gammaproteobacteria bacterium]